MARKKMRRFAEGGNFSASDEIVVKGRRPREEISTFDLSRIGGSGGLGGGMLAGVANTDGGMDGGQRLDALTPPPRPVRDRMAVQPAVVRQAPSALGNIMGDRGAKAYGAKGSFRFKEGGKVKKKASGGKVSSASKRGDGCATKGKTKGRFV
jgi:hypothetical protein